MGQERTTRLVATLGPASLRTAVLRSLASQGVDLHVRLAQEAGFTIINLQNWFENQDLKRMIVEEWDRHPSAEGHKLIADKLYDALRQEQRTPAIGHPILEQ